MAPQELTGILVALITPFKADGSVDYEALDAHIQSQISAGVHGLVPGGSTGEFTALTVQERKDVLTQVIKSAAGRVPLASVTLPPLESLTLLSMLLRLVLLLP
jgi:dihydrodipicolinate synthase/N-acetylneuraminate lyase